MMYLGDQPVSLNTSNGAAEPIDILEEIGLSVVDGQLCITYEEASA